MDGVGTKCIYILPLTSPPPPFRVQIHYESHWKRWALKIEQLQNNLQITQINNDI